jgi:anaerobic selenocysteine-containing dehydrogenase
VRTVTSFCRTCTAGCGTKLTIDDQDRIVSIRGDENNAMSRGYACFKGIHSHEAQYSPERLLHPLKRQPDGTFTRISIEQALDEIAEKMKVIIDRDGPEALGLFIGNGANFNSAAFSIHLPFMQALGSRHFFTTNTLDQSAKMITYERMGFWAAGPQRFDTADVMMVFGSNPLISHASLNFLMSDPVRTMKAARARGLKLIVVDPRLTETARYADIHLQPIPGHDATIAAGMIRMILAEGWEDKEFCERYVGPEGMAALREAVEPFNEEMVTYRAGLPEGQLRAATEMFARDSKRGPVSTGTGNNFGPHSNVAQHLADAMNVVCGRFLREGDTTLVEMLSPEAPIYPEVIPPSRTWEHVPPSRIRGVGTLLNREEMSGTLPDEILTPGKGQIRGLLIQGGNPVLAIPGQKKVVEAMKSLELSVMIDPFMHQTSQYCDYILPPKMPYERSDLPLTIPTIVFTNINWIQYTPPVVPPPAGSELVEDWQVYTGIAKRLGLTIEYNHTTVIDLDTVTTDDLLAIRAADGRVKLDEMKQYPSGNSFPFASERVAAPRPEGTARFDVMPADVRAELDEALRYDITPDNIVSDGKRFTHLVSCRRMRHMFNSVGTIGMPSIRAKAKFNPAYINPADMAELGLENGDHIELESDVGKITAIAEADETMRPGVISIPHGFGPATGEMDEDGGVSIGALIVADKHYQHINAIPRMTAIPVNVRRLNSSIVGHQTAEVE